MYLIEIQMIKKKFEARWQWHASVTTVLGKQKQENLCEYETSQVYKVNSRTVTQRNTSQ